jgi:hypothetical protein
MSPSSQLSEMTMLKTALLRPGEPYLLKTELLLHFCNPRVGDDSSTNKLHSLIFEVWVGETRSEPKA